jgi:hypothetical protein
VAPDGAAWIKPPDVVTRRRAAASLRGQAAAATTGVRRSSATAYATRDPVPIALATDRAFAVAASPAA